MTNIRIDVSGAKAKLAKIRGGLNDFTEPLAEAGEEFREYLGETNFEGQGSPLSGSPWKSLAASTLLARERRTGHYANTPIATDKILVWTGALKAGFVQTVKKTSLVITNTVKYFKFNHPTRPMLGENQSLIDIATTKVMTYIRNLIK